MPWEPHRIGGREERRGGLVQIAQQAAQRGGSVQAPRAEMGELAVDERQHLAAVVVQAGTDQAGRSGKAQVPEVAQQGMHCWCPRPVLRNTTLPRR
jgi:hypothetical protein